MIKSKILVVLMGIGLMLANNMCQFKHILPGIPPGERLKQAFEHCYNMEKYCCRTTEWWAQETKAEGKRVTWDENDCIETMIFNAPNLLYQERKIRGRRDPDINCYIGNEQALETTSSDTDGNKLEVFPGLKGPVYLVFPRCSSDPIAPWMILRDGLLNSPFYLSSQIKILERNFGDWDNMKLYYDNGTRYKENVLCDVIVVEPFGEIREGLLSPVLVKSVDIEFFRITFWIRSGTVPLIDKIIYEVHFSVLDPNAEIPPPEIPIEPPLIASRGAIGSTRKQSQATLYDASWGIPAPNILIGGREFWKVNKEVLYKLRL
ncbi:MAG: hypothetical protein V1709_03675, partial [Planctomycetota bacterium]